MLQVGEIIKTPFLYAVISWRIPNVSSLLTPEYNSVQSPLFSFNCAIWKFKLYPYGCTHPNETGGIEMVMERLHSQIPVHNVFCIFYFKKHGCVETDIGSHHSFVFDSSSEKRSVGRKWSNILQFYKEHRYGDTLTSVCEVYSKRKSEIETDFDTKCFKGYSSKCFLLFLFLFAALHRYMIHLPCFEISVSVYVLYFQLILFLWDYTGSFMLYLVF